MKLDILVCAEQDLLDGIRFYQKREPWLGEYFLDSLSADIDSLMIFAGTHRKVGRYHRSLATRFPYAIYYTLDCEAVSIWAVLDCRRDPVWIKKQLVRRKVSGEKRA